MPLLNSKSERDSVLHSLVRERENGNAQIEFIGVVVALIIPIVFLIVSLSTVHAAKLASASGAHGVARSYALTGTDSDAKEIASLALKDHGFSSETLKINISCSDSCVAGGIVSAQVSFKFAVPGLGWTQQKPLQAKSFGYSYRGEMVAND